MRCTHFEVIGSLLVLLGRTREEGVVAAFLELHHDVDERAHAALHTLAQRGVVLREDVPGKGIITN